MKDIFDLSAKKIIVSGASGGIGLACAKAVAAFGAKLILLGRNAEKLAQAREAVLCAAPGCAAEYTALDFGDSPKSKDQPNTQLRDFFAAHSDASVLVNSIGVNIPQSILSVTESGYDAVMQANVKLAFFQTQYFVHAKCAQNSEPSESASIIHISSQMGHVGGPERSVYCASKHALEGLCKAAALELGPKNIRINTICPTFIETELSRTTLDDAAKKERILQNIPLNRLGQLEDLYGAVVYLASDASALVSGTALKVDGGWTAH